MDNLFEQDKNFLYGVNDNYNDTGEVITGNCANCNNRFSEWDLILLPDGDIFICTDCIHNAKIEDFQDESDNDKEMILKMRIDAEVTRHNRELRLQVEWDGKVRKEFSQEMEMRKLSYFLQWSRERLLNNHN